MFQFWCHLGPGVTPTPRDLGLDDEPYINNQQRKYRDGFAPSTRVEYAHDEMPN